MTEFSPNPLSNETFFGRPSPFEINRQEVRRAVSDELRALVDDGTLRALVEETVQRMTSQTSVSQNRKGRK